VRSASAGAARPASARRSVCSLIAAAAIREQTDRLADAGLAAPAEALRTLRAYVMGSVALEVQRSGWTGEAVESGDEAVAAFEHGLRAVLGGLTTEQAAG